MGGTKQSCGCEWFILHDGKHKFHDELECMTYRSVSSIKYRHWNMHLLSPVNGILIWWGTSFIAVILLSIRVQCKDFVTLWDWRRGPWCSHLEAFREGGKEVGGLPSPNGGVGEMGAGIEGIWQCGVHQTSSRIHYLTSSPWPFAHKQVDRPRNSEYKHSPNFY